MYRRVAAIALVAFVISLATTVVAPQTPPFIETGLPGPAFSGVVPAPNGRLYGVTYEGGTSNKGTLYSVDATLLGVVVHVNFNVTNGAIPYDELTYDAASGKFYGTTEQGGALGAGTIFSYVPGASTVTTLKDNFGSGFFAPGGPLVVSGGHIFGVVRGTFGGVFRMAIDGTGFTIIHQFDLVAGGAGVQPVTLGPDGRLYGVTIRGGVTCYPNDTVTTCGTVFRLRAVVPNDPNQNVEFQTLYTVTDRFNGGLQRTVTYGSDGLIYFNNHRRILRLNPSSPAATFQMVWEEPSGSVSMSVIEGSDNRLYVASYDNAQSGFAGSVFTLNRDGTDKQVLRLFSFTVGSRAYGPYGRLYRTGSGVVYGTTEYTIPAPEYGTVFAIGAGSNTPPVLGNVAATSPVIENSSTTISGTITDPDANNTFVLTVNWGDGSAPQFFNYPAGTTSFSETHQYLDDNPTGTPSDQHTIGLTLADNSGASDTDSASVMVTNAPPTLTNLTVNPAIIVVGQSTGLSGNIGDPGSLDPHDVTINWGDGSPNTVLNLGAGVTSFNTTHQYNSIATFNIAVTVTDDDTGSTNGGAVVNVNTPPQLSNVAVTSPIAENGTANLSGNIIDPNAGDSFSLTVDWGDGSPPQQFGYVPGTTAFNETHQYRDDNPTGTPADVYTISLVLSDTREGDTDSTMVTVQNAPPTLQNLAVSPATINVGGITNVTGLVVDAGTLDTHQVVINWGDGSPNTTVNLPIGTAAFNQPHQYDVSGTFGIRVTATDDDSGSVLGSVNINVNSAPQVPPVLTNVAVSSPVIENGTATLTGNISDANASDSFTLTVNWADGSASQIFNYPAGTTSFTATHQYIDDDPTGTPADVYSIGLVLNDSAGGTDTDSAVLTVNNALPALSNIIASPATINIGGSSNLSGTVTDVGTLDTHRIVINWGDGTPNTIIDLAAGVTAFNTTHQFNAAGTFNIAVTATDDDTGSANGGATVSVTQPSGGKIAFASLRDGSYEIYSMNPDGSNQTRLTDNTASDIAPSVSPDGSQIVFVSNREGNNDIYLMNSDGTGQTRLTKNSATDHYPSFSPEGNRIVFSSRRANGDHDVYVMNADGTDQDRLTNNAANDFEPVFSPDGSKIAFTSQRDGFGQVYLMNVDGSNEVRLTNVAADEYDPSFSPDGSRIAFTSFRHGATNEIYVMNIDGSNQTRLTDNVAGDVSASFSPDGSQIAFASNRDGRLEIYVMNADGTNQVRLTDNAEGNEYPSWELLPSVSAGRIVFNSRRDGNFEIYSMNANGTSSKRLTNNPADDLSPSLSPDGSRIAFVSQRDGNYEIYVMNSDGTGQTRLTTNQAVEAQPSFSHDGNRIAFVSYRDDNYEIYVMNSDGTNQTRLTNNAITDYQPAFGADGRIAFASYRNGNFDIYIMNSDGTNQMQVTANPADDNAPAFAPDGASIAFASYRDGNAEIYKVNTNGTNLTRLTDDPAADSFPTYSPDGTQIAFTAYRHGAGGEIYRVNADGTNPRRLTNNPADDVFPSWGSTPPTAPGRKIAFYSSRDGNSEIYAMNSNGTNQARLTNDPADDLEPAFSPNGSRIAFASNRDGDYEIYVMNSDGTDPIRLTDNGATDSEPSFSPDGNRIVFTSDRSGSYEIWVMNADGTNQSRLTNSPGDDRNPIFSPNGNFIVFYSARNGGGIYYMQPNGANQTFFTFGYEPSFSPDGSRLVFTSGDAGGIGVFIINANGTGRTRLTPTSSLNFDPAFSPDGMSIAFESLRDGNFQIYRMNTDGSDQIRLTNNAANDFSPSFGNVVLAAPTNLTVTPVSPTRIDLAWTDNSNNEDGFSIERCEGNGKCNVFIQIAGTSANATAYSSAGLKPNTFYTYRVRAFSTAGNSHYSNSAKDKTPKP